MYEFLEGQHEDGTTTSSKRKLCFGEEKKSLKREREHGNKNQQVFQKEVRYNLNSLQLESVQEVYKNRLDEKLVDNQFNNVEEHYRYIQDCIREAAKEALGYHETVTKAKPYWWSRDIETQIRSKKEKFNKLFKYEERRR